MIVTVETVDKIIERLSLFYSVLAVDTETSGLYRFRGDRLFSIIIHDGEKGYYFNFNDMNETDRQAGVTVLPREVLEKLKPLFAKRSLTWIMANAKFDLHMLDAEGIEVAGPVWDVLVMARIEKNDHFKYGLDACAERIGFKKSTLVDDFVKKWRCYKKEKIPGKKGVKKNPQYWMVPLPLVSEYGIKDALLTYKLYEHQQKYFAEWEGKSTNGTTSIWSVINNEIELTKVCFHMEKRGFLLDANYVKSAMAYEEDRAKIASDAFKAATGSELVDSYSALRKAFAPLGITGAVTEKGNPSFKDEVLNALDHDGARALLQFRDANKRASTYYASFLFFADSSDLIHCNIRQSATATGRFSISDPALQTLNAEAADDEGNYKTEWRIRRAFRPRPDYCLVAIDFKAFEFRAMLDTAGEQELADKIASGHDPHQATADLVNITRKQAKTINFGLIYGMGAGKLAASLGTSIKGAKEIKWQYFDALPKVQELIRCVTFTAEQKQRVLSRFGRPYFFDDPKWAYKALNALIQGGTADAIKFAMVRLNREIFKSVRSGILLQIHDELLFEIHKDELYLIPEIKKVMEESWPSNFHKMECSVEHSWTSWGELIEGSPTLEGLNGEQARDVISEAL